jgi:two-component system OmpR family sensor kinase
LSNVDATLGRLQLIEWLVTSGVVVAVALLAWFVVRVGLRPLGAIELTAAAIAEGDMTRRVRRDDASTEVGRLGRSINAMLSKIEEAFGQRAASEERLRQFVSDASHELRTPITSIRGYAELYRRGALPDEAALSGAMQRIEREAERMGVLVEDLLLLARLDQRRPLDLQPVDVVQIATEVAADAAVVNRLRSFNVEASTSAVVRGDALRLRQVVINLVQNAIVHTPPEAPISVRVRVEEHLAVIEVADEGPGIAPGHLARLFERFYRADSSRARETGGSGLGLSIVAAIAEAHGGRAAVTSEIAKGSTFRVELPLLSTELVHETALPE